MSRTGTARAATVSKQLRRAGFIVGRTGVNEHEADVLVRSSCDEVRVLCRVQPDADPQRVAENTQEIITVLVNKGYDIHINDNSNDPDAPCVFLHLSRPKWHGQEEVANRLGDIVGKLIDPTEAIDQAPMASVDREIGSVVAVAPDGRDGNLRRTGGGVVIEEIAHVPAAHNAVMASGGKLKRCQCGGVQCTATTKRAFAPGHDAAMVSRWAARVAEGVATLSDAERNILAAGGSGAMMGKVRAAVARKTAKQDAPASRTIRVRVELTIEVTPEGADALNLAYGCGNSDAEIRTFVREYIRNDAQQCTAGENWSVR